MKNLLILAASLISISASAQTNAHWQPSSNTGAVKKAVIEAIGATTLTCSGTTVRNGTTNSLTFKKDVLNTYIEVSDGVFVSNDFSQPLIKFAAHQNNVDLVVYVTTAADRNTITRLDVEYKLTETKSVRGGTLDHPTSQQVTAITETDTGTCQ